MLKKFFTVLLLGSFLLASPYTIFAADRVSPVAGWSPECAPGGVPSIKGLECLFERVLSVALTIIGIGAFVMILVAGFKWLTSGGDPKQTESAQQTITWVVGGLAAAIIVWFLLQLIANFTGLDNLLLNFSVTN